jgi:stage III sporulation protein AB
MLIKIIGSIMILSASGFLGYALSRDCTRRPKELRELQGQLQMLENEIGFMSNVLADAFDRVCISCSSEVSASSDRLLQS